MPFTHAQRRLRLKQLFEVHQASENVVVLIDRDGQTITREVLAEGELSTYEKKRNANILENQAALEMLKLRQEGGKASVEGNGTGRKTVRWSGMGQGYRRSDGCAGGTSEAYPLFPARSRLAAIWPQRRLDCSCSCSCGDGWKKVFQRCSRCTLPPSNLGTGALSWQACGIDTNGPALRRLSAASGWAGLGAGLVGVGRNWASEIGRASCRERV